MPPTPTTSLPVNFGAINLQPQGQQFNPVPQPTPPTTSQQTNPDGFKALILAKYPDGVSSDGRKYADIPAQELTQKITDKYPTGVTNDGRKYSDFLSPPPQITSSGTDISAPNVQKARDEIVGVGNQIKDAFVAGGNQAAEGVDQAIHSTNPLEGVAGGMHALAGAVGAVASPLAPVINPILSPLVKNASDTLSNTKPFQEYGQDPTANANDLPTKLAQGGADASTVAGAIVGGAQPKMLVSDLSTLADKGSAVASSVADTFKPTPAKLKADAITNINKGLGNIGKKSASAILSNDTNRLKGLETLYTATKDQPITRPDGSTFNFDPTNITDPKDLVSAFMQAKNTIWSKVQNGLDKGSSIVPNYSNVESNLKDVIANSASKALKAHAQSRLDEVQQLKTQGVQGAQRYLQEELNPRIGAAISGANDAPALKLDARLASGVNDALDNGLAKVKGGSIGPLKDMYASLKSIEPDLVRTVQKVIRAPGGGIPQYINDFGNMALFEAAFAHNPALFIAKGVGQKVLAKVLATQRDPLDHISKAFQSIAQYMGDPKLPAEPPMLTLPAGTRGAPSQVSSSAPIQLPAQWENINRTTLPPFNK